MSTTSFRLQRVLDYRRNTLDRLRLDLAVLEAGVRRECDVLASLRATEDALLHELHTHHGRPCTIDDIVRVSEQIERLRARIVDQIALLQRMDGEVEIVRGHLEATNKSMKTLEQLRERDAMASREEERRLERIETAEIAALHSQRGRR
jgi:flagellar export protein FliJ